MAPVGSLSALRQKRAGWLAPALLFGLALALRLYNLSYHSLWFDEVMSTVWAAKPAKEIWRVGLALVEDKHPPLYYLLLHGWSGVFGGSDAAVRWLGAILGAFAVIPAHAMGLRLGNRQSAALGALFVALNPFLIWYSQEARMFMPATTFALIGLYGILRLGDRGEGLRVRRRGAGVLWAGLCIVVGFTAALYTYLFSAFLLPVAAVWLVIMAWQARGDRGITRIGLPGFLALGAVVLIFVPLARSAWLVSGSESAPGRAFSGMMASAWSLMTVYALGWPSWPAAIMQLLTASFLALTLAGLLPYPRVRPFTVTQPVGGLLLAMWLGLPLLVGGLLLARDRTVFTETRYFIFIVPALCLSWGRALGWVLARSRIGGALLLALAVAVTVAALPYLWTPENRKEAWREAAAFVEAHAGPNDAVLIQADYVHPAFERYFRGSQPVFHPFTDRLADAAQVEAPLQGLGGFDGVWLVESHHEDLDPEGLVAGWLSARAPIITEVFPPGIAVRGYLQQYQPDAVPAGLTGGGEAPGFGLKLLGCDVKPSRLNATDDLLHPPSNWIHVTTYWTAGASPARDIAPEVRLLDRAGQVWGLSLGRAGSSFERHPPTMWKPGQIVRADFDVNVNPITPAGVYRLGVSASGDTGPPLPCGEAEITD
jgi:4-amino-4-deoxy-L-arabinose transferase-like glycosyltransferase